MNICQSILKSGKRKGDFCGIKNCKKHLKNLDNINTFVDLYNFLREYPNDSILNWLKTNWIGKDKQESLFRLFSKLELITCINGWKICSGNFNLKTITPIKDKRSIFYSEKNKLISLNDKGDSADLIAIDEKDDKKLLCFSSKNLDKENIGKLDIDKIFFHATKNYKEKEIIYGLVVRDKNETRKIIEKAEKTNNELKIILNDPKTIYIDWNDLDQAFKIFKQIYNTKSINDLFETEKNPILFKLHQKYSILKTCNLINKKTNNILWGHICRSGKSYIIAGVIIEDSKQKQKCNYLLLTTAPNETIEQYIKVMYCEQLHDFNVIYVNGNNINPVLRDKNIIIISKQFLQVLDDNNTKRKNKLEKLNWLSSLKIDLRFIDESHNGGTTQIVKNTLELYGKKIITIHISATYSKTAKDYNIPKEHWVLWDLEDINLCKSYNTERLIEKYGVEMKETLNHFNENSIKAEYSKFPKMWIITDELNDDCIKKIINYNNTNNQNSEKGWSTDACFLLNQNENSFQNPEENLHLWYRIFGKKNHYEGFSDDDCNYPKEKVIINRIQNICSINESRTFSREEPLVIIAFLPIGQNAIDKVQNATKKILEDNKVIPDYDIICINSKESNDPKKMIEDGLIITKNNNKKGLLVLSGRQCSLGITIDKCDIVLLLNDSSSFDMTFQMMFRSMTEYKDKKFGFVVDLNIHRFITTTLLNFISSINPNEHPKKILEYILKEKIININNDQWIMNDNQYIDKMIDNIYKVYSSNIEKSLEHLLNRLEYKRVLLSKDDGVIFNNIFMDKTKFTKEQNEKLTELSEKLFNDDRENIKKGISKEYINNDEESKHDNEEEKEEQKKNLIEFLKHIIPLICILTIHDDKSSSFEEMSNYILSNSEILEVFQQQTMTWWGQDTDKNILKVFMILFTKYLQNDSEVLQIIRTIKEFFCKNVNNSRELSKLIDKYLVPHSIEKKQNAEVSTPYQLRQEMLDTITKYGDCNFWKTPKKVFEPCAGKGGFLLDVIDRFMVGLEDEKKDPEKKYKLIVEECLYWSELNPVNVFICKLLLDPYGKYRLNYHEGNTLELDIGKKWEGRVGEGFDLVIGNPPYNIPKEDKLRGGYGGRSLWDKFVKRAIENWNKKKGYLCFIHPPSWRKPEHELWELMTRHNQIMYLKTYSKKEGNLIFKCSTLVDYYLLQKTPIYTDTIIDGQDKTRYTTNLREWNFLPSGKFDIIKKILGKNEVIYSSSIYDTRRNYIKKTQDNEYKYPVIHNMTKEYGNGYVYSSENKGHFGITKVILSFGEFQYPYNDWKGEYGMSQICYGLPIKNEKEGNDICRAINSNSFREILKYTKWSTFQTDWRMFRYFKPDFWREFIIEE